MNMAKLVFNGIPGKRLRKWYLFLETLRDIIPYIFACNNIEYSRYLMVMLCEMLLLETNYLKLYQQFVEVNFTVQISA